MLQCVTVVVDPRRCIAAAMRCGALLCAAWCCDMLHRPAPRCKAPCCDALCHPLMPRRAAACLHRVLLRSCDVLQSVPYRGILRLSLSILVHVLLPQCAAVRRRSPPYAVRCCDVICRAVPHCNASSCEALCHPLVVCRRRHRPPSMIVMPDCGRHPPRAAMCATPRCALSYYHGSMQPQSVTSCNALSCAAKTASNCSELP